MTRNLLFPVTQVWKPLSFALALLTTLAGCDDVSPDSGGKDSILAPLTVENPRVEYKHQPLGLDITSPRFSWELKGEGRNRSQSAYHILVSSSEEKLASGKGDVWDTGKIPTMETNQIEYSGSSLESMKQYFWKLRVWDEKGRASEWSATQRWSMGILNYSDWKGIFLGLNVGQTTGDKYRDLYLPPARYLRKSFRIEKLVKRATVVATALGLYELRLNGSKVGEDYFLPGWTDYDKRLYYQTYDVTGQLAQGENVIGAVIADGWYAGYVGYGLLIRLEKVRSFYGENPAFMGQLLIEYEDGTSEWIVSDRTWKANKGAILEADILMGEKHDARLEPTGWDTAGFDDSKWKNPALYPWPNGRLQAYPGEKIKVRERLTSVAITQPKPGVFVFNLGKNIAGIPELKVNGPAGTEIELKFGEILAEDGTVLTENLRKARATDTYILRGGGEEVWQPKFTYHGFQFVQVTGFPGTPAKEAITGLVLSSIEADKSTFSTSNPMNNQLYQNIKTTQLANFFEVPTDCPQRDERLGWTGDAQTYCRSSTYNADVAPFFTKYLIDLDDAQRWYGAYPNYAPYVYSRPPHRYSPAWMDAGIIIPYNIYKVYGDKRILEYVYPGMEKFMKFQAEASTDYLRPGAGNNFGDWLSVGERTSHDFIASAFYGFDAKLMAEMALALGKEEDHQMYLRLFEKIKEAFSKKYILENGFTSEETQTSYALALYFDLYPDDLAPKAAARLAQKIRENGNKFKSGFLGTKHIMPVLSRYGYDDLAFTLFQQTEYPSWGFSVVNGSTSIWERWNSLTKDAQPNSAINTRMNSFSHYAFGSVCEWMFQHALGIDTDGPGYRNIIIKPAFSREMDSIGGSYASINGPIKSAWKWEGNDLKVNIEIPANTKARVYLPGSQPTNIMEGQSPVSKSKDVKIIGTEENRTILSLGSGTYQFTVKTPPEKAP